MGAWGTGTFENDDAMDFVIILLESDSLSPVEKVLRAVVDVEDYLEVDQGANGLAAAEVIAALRGHPGKLPSELEAWVTKIGTASDEMVTLARRAVGRIMTENSELRDLWEETDEFSVWQAEVDDLLKRLDAA